MATLKTLRERIKSYEDLTDYKLLRKLPVITIINGRGFRKTTSLLNKPFSLAFVELMGGVMIKLMGEINGSIFSYGFNDEIIVVSRNDQTIDTNAWYDNRIQKISSISSSLATYEIQRLAKEKDIELFGEAIFSAHTFAVPSITEVSNLLIAKQNEALYLAISMACFYSLAKKYNIESVKETIAEKSSQGKLDILAETCGIDFEKDFPNAFKRGIGCYRAQRFIDNGDIRSKLKFDIELPVFAKEPDFLNTILSAGKDIIRL